MASINYLLVLSIIIVNSVKNLESTPTCVKYDSEWNFVTKGWPRKDPEDIYPHQFYYNDFMTLHQLVLSSSLKDHLNTANLMQPPKLTLKFWQYGKPGDPYNIFNDPNGSVLTNYYNSYMDHWMPLEYNIPIDQFGIFHFVIHVNKSMTALKDIELEYISHDDKIRDNSISNEKGWEEYVIPVIDDNNEDDFIYFPDCSNTCKIKITLNSEDGYSDEDIILKFRYWAYNKVNIKVLNNDITLTNDTWKEVVQNINLTSHPNLKSENGVVMQIQFLKGAYFALKGLKIEYHSKKHSSTFNCSKNDCIWDWIANGKYFWANSLKYYKPIDESNKEQRILYYPTEEENMYLIKTPIKRNSCIKLEYWSLNKNPVINMYYSFNTTGIKDEIISIKPQIDDYRMQSTDICLYDYIALNFEKVTISINATQRFDTTSINGFGLRYSVQSKEGIDIYKEAQTFLNSFNDLLTLKDEWKMFVPSPGPLDLSSSDKKVSFKAYVDSYSVSTAQMFSIWLKYDPILLEDLIYKVIIPDVSMNEYFKITPKICDSLTFCREGFLKEMKDLHINGKTEKNYTYQFKPFEHSEFIKLTFLIEYFIPRNNSPKDVLFDIALLYFGDPCFDPKSCPENAECYSDPKIPLSKSYEEKCECPSSGLDYIYIDPNCTILNACIKNGKSKCSESHAIGCEPDGIDYKCICPTQGNIALDDSYHKCIPPIPSFNTWTPVDPSLKAFTKSSNDKDPLKLNFNYINTDKLDVCLSVTTKSQKNFDIEIEYEDEVPPKVPQKLIVYTNEGEKVMQFCMRDFIMSVSTKFSIAITVTSTDPTWPDGFTLEYAAHTKELLNENKSKKPYLTLWENKQDVTKNIKTFIPSDLLINNSNFTIKAKKDEIFRIYSDWIDHNSIYINKKENNVFYYNVTLDAHSETYVNVEVEKCNIVNNKFSCEMILNKNRLNTAVGIKNFESSFIDNEPSKTDFKILLKVISTQDVSVTFTSIMFGDPCYKNGQCQHGKCIRDTSKLIGYYCDCNTGYSEDFCNVENSCDKNNGKEICQFQPSFGDKKGCFHININTFTCSCPTKHFKWNGDKKICERNAPQKFKIRCEEKNCDIFKNVPDIFKWSPKSFPSIDNGIFDFYYFNESHNELKYLVTNFNNDSLDGYIEFKYFSTKDDQLYIKYNDKKVFSLPKTYNSSTSQIDWTPDFQKLYLRDLVRNIEDNFDISIVYDYSEENSAAIKFLNFPNTALLSFTVKENPSSYPFLINNNYTYEMTDYVFKNQFRYLFPKENFPKEDINKGIFMIKDYLPDKHKSAYIMSQWISEWKKGMVFRFAFKPEVNEKAIFDIQIIVYNENMIKINESMKYTKEIIKGLKDDLISYQIPEIAKSFRVGIIISYKKSDIIGNLNTFIDLFELGPFALGDPCMKPDSLFVQNCNGITKCERLGPVDNFTCNCPKEYNITNDCTVENFCFVNHPIKTRHENQTITDVMGNGNDFCKKHAGLNSSCNSKKLGILNFICDCKDDHKFWNHKFQNCSNWPLCAQINCDPLTEVCREPTPPKTTPQCDCREGFKKEISTQKCIIKNICKEENPCGSHPHMNCYPIKNALKGYICECARGFKPEFNTTANITECVSDLCNYPTLHQCSQKCENTKDSYECKCNEEMYTMKDNKCNLNSNKECTCPKEQFCKENGCVCKPGFEFINNKCQIIKNYDNGEKYQCEISAENGKINCTCPPPFIISADQTCSFETKCNTGGEGRHACEKKSAKCLTKENSFGNYICECPPGMRFKDNEMTDDPSNVNNTCISVCDLYEKENICAIGHGKCNPWKLDRLDEADSRTFEKYCDCLPGYIKTKTSCLLAKNTAKFQLIIKNTHHYPNNLSLYSSVPFIYRSSNNLIRKKRALTVNSIFDLDKNGLYSALVEEEKLNSEFEEKAIQELTKFQFIDFIKNQADEVLKEIELIKDKNKISERISVEKCEPLKDPNDLYECYFVVALDESINLNLESLNEMKKGCRNISYGESKNLCLFTLSETLIIKQDGKTFMPTEYSACDDKNSCFNSLSNCIQSEDNYYDCKCGENFTIVDEIYIQTENIQDYYKHKIQICEPKNLCESCKRTDHKDCIQQDPKYNPDKKVYEVQAHCSCAQNYTATDNEHCIESCPKDKCGHGRCEHRGKNGFACVCDESWYGSTCDKEYSVSNGGWIAGIVVLAVLVVLAAGVALYFAKRSRDSSPYNGNNTSHQMDDFSNPPSRRFGQENPSFHRD